MEKYPIILIPKKKKTKRNTYWTNSKVHSYLKWYNEKSERQNYINKFYEMKWIGKMSIKYYEIYWFICRYRRI